MEDLIYNTETDKILVREGYKYTNEMPKYNKGSGYRLIHENELNLMRVSKNKVGSEIRVYLYRDMMYVEVETSYGALEYATHLELLNFKEDTKIRKSSKIYKYNKREEYGDEIDIEYIEKAVETLVSLVNY